MDPTPAPTTTEEATLVAWSPVYVTLIISLVVGLLFYAFFSKTRRNHAAADKMEIFETRQFLYDHRSPEPFDTLGKCCGWAAAAYRMDNKELLRCIGLDSYMFLRFLRLGARLSFVGTLMSVVLIPVYATGEAEGLETEEFNSLTLAKVEAGSGRLWVTAFLWTAMVVVALREIYQEWLDYAPLRYEFLAHGDPDTDKRYRYSCRVEHLPAKLQSNFGLKNYLERLFPGDIRQVSVLVQAKKLEELIEERFAVLQKYEAAVAFTKAKPEKPSPTVKVGGGCCGGGEVKEAIPYYQAELERLNADIDAERAEVHHFADTSHHQGGELEEAQKKDKENEEDGFEVVMASSAENNNSKKKKKNKSLIQSVQQSMKSPARSTCSTAFVTFASLKAKQAAIQCQISDKADYVEMVPAPIPKGILWKNALTPASQQRTAGMFATAFWLTGILFWAVPVSFVTGLANLNSILTSVGLDELDSDSFYYGLLAGLLPVIFLQALLFALYLAIGLCAMYWVRKKSMPEVDAYTFVWHQLYQFANLWLILIGGSAFNQLDAVINDPSSIATLLASALPGASAFFLNMIIMQSFLMFGVELSCIAQYGVQLALNFVQPEAMKTQRMLDDSKKPQTIIWGKIIPPMIFVFLVALVYMPIVPLMEAFAFVYFAGWYLVWKHQCLHVYHQEFEGGGLMWEGIFGFIMACLYTAEFIVVAYLGLKEGIGPAIFCVVPVVGTIYIHMRLRKHVIGPLQNLSLEVAADVDMEEGELSKSVHDDGPSAMAVEEQLYGQPSLKASLDEREPMPYRREEKDTDVAVQELAAQEEGISDTKEEEEGPLVENLCG